MYVKIIAWFSFLHLKDVFGTKDCFYALVYFKSELNFLRHCDEAIKNQINRGKEKSF